MSADAARIDCEEVEVQRDLVAERDVVREVGVADDGCERSPHRAACGAQALGGELAVAVGPERAQQRFAASAALRLQREKREDLCIATTEPGDPLTFDANFGFAEQPYRERRERAGGRRRTGARHARN